MLKNPLLFFLTMKCLANVKYIIIFLRFWILCGSELWALNCIMI